MKLEPQDVDPVVAILGSSNKVILLCHAFEAVPGLCGVAGIAETPDCGWKIADSSVVQ